MRGIVLYAQKFSVDDKGNVRRDPAVFVIDWDFNLWRVRIDPESVDLLEVVEFEEGEPVDYSSLNSLGKDVLRDAVERIVLDRKEDFLRFLNNPPQISIRMNSLELLPGIGKKTLKRVLEGRPYDDIPERLLGSLVDRVVEELAEPQKYYLFVGDKSYFAALKKMRKKK